MKRNLVKYIIKNNKYLFTKNMLTDNSLGKENINQLTSKQALSRSIKQRKCIQSVGKKPKKLGFHF